MVIRRSSVALVLACYVALHSNPNAAEYVGPATSPDFSSGEQVPSATDHLRTIPRSAYENPPEVGVPFRTIFRSTNAPYYDQLRGITLSPSARTGESVEIRSNLDLPDFRGSFPLLQRGFPPEEADLKVG